MVEVFNKLKPTIGALDTETNGLHIIQSIPFLVQFGFLDPDSNEAYTYSVDLERQPILARAVISKWLELATSLKIMLGHNIKFDLHMLSNIGFQYTTENLSDTMFYIRYAHDNLTPEHGGPPMKLKEYTARYIWGDAKSHEALLDNEKSNIAKELNLKLKIRLKNCGEPPAKYHARTYNLSVLEDIFKDPITDYNDLPENVIPHYLEWLQLDVPIYLQPKIVGLVDSNMIPYNILNRSNLTKYAHYDIIYTIEIYLSLKDVIEARGNQRGIEIEDSLIFPFFYMERVGFLADKAYIEVSRLRMKEYIIQLREELFALAEREFTIGQDGVIKDILNNDFGLNLATTKKEELEQTLSVLRRENNTSGAIQFIELVQSLRSLEKWYSTYIIRFLRDLTSTDKLYTTINQVGTVSGRVTSSFQQFPKEAISTKDGEEIFHPRKMIKPEGGDYDSIIFLDYSQIELRFQAMLTILVGDADLNLCRAYMPHKCINRLTGKAFSSDDIPLFTSGRLDGEYRLQEDPEVQWVPTDVHGTTTQLATGLSPGDPDFKRQRTLIGKKVNFAKNYGAKFNKIKEIFPEKSDEEIRQIDDAYYKAFPGVKSYHSYCYGRAQEFAYTTNLFGVRYYGLSGHKLINTLIQGPAAYFLKLKIRELYDFGRARGIQSLFQMNIHDELSWLKHKRDDPALFFEFQKIMQDWPDTLIPIIAEMSVTKTNWAEKEEVHNLNELQTYLSN